MPCISSWKYVVSGKLTLLIWLFEKACVSSHQIVLGRVTVLILLFMKAFGRTASTPSGKFTLVKLFPSKAPSAITKLPLRVILCVTVSLYDASMPDGKVTDSTPFFWKALLATPTSVLPLSSFDGSTSFLFLANLASPFAEKPLIAFPSIFTVLV